VTNQHGSNSRYSAAASPISFSRAPERKYRHFYWGSPTGRHCTPSGALSIKVRAATSHSETATGKSHLFLNGPLYCALCAAPYNDYALEPGFRSRNSLENLHLEFRFRGASSCACAHHSSCSVSTHRSPSQWLRFSTVRLQRPFPCAWQQFSTLCHAPSSSFRSRCSGILNNPVRANAKLYRYHRKRSAEQGCILVSFPLRSGRMRCAFRSRQCFWRIRYLHRASANARLSLHHSHGNFYRGWCQIRIGSHHHCHFSGDQRKPVAADADGRSRSNAGLHRRSPE
jgi:hypothetical protein